MQHAWAETQAQFAACIADPTLPTPSGVIECGRSSPRAGFSVYRNNSMMSLIEGLRERFPVTRRLAGEECFRAMARSYASRFRPRTPILTHYGDDFPQILDNTFAAAGDFHYLGDVARLELAWSESYHSPECTSLPPRVLAEVTPEALLGMRLRLHASTRILRSHYPVVHIWAAHQRSGEIEPPADWHAQDVLIVRPDADVQVHAISPGVHPFVAALLNGSRVQDAAERALAESRTFDVGASMLFLFRAGVVAALGQPSREIAS